MQTPREKTLRFFLAGALLVGALFLVSRGHPPPPLPADPDHRGATANSACAPCHAAGAPHPLDERHPPKEDCLYCHRPAG